MDVKPYYRWDERRTLLIPGDRDETIAFAAEQWIEIGRQAIQDHLYFYVALSGGSTPKSIFHYLSTSYVDQIDWSKILFFWSDERAVPPDDMESNFHMAMIEGGLTKLPIPTENIFRMLAETNLEENARNYEKTIREHLQGRPFDLVMLGMGDDGHTASLFPKSEALHAQGRLVVPNFHPEKRQWRMTFTYECINASERIFIYVLGGNKSEIVKKVFTSPFNPELYPVQKVGTAEHPAIWILDHDASKNLFAALK